MRLVFLCALAGCAAEGGGALPDMSTADLAPAPTSSDSLPAGAITFVRGDYCPDGWTLYYSARGRFLVPRLGDGAGAPSTSGTPLQGSEDRAHGHTLTAQVTLDRTSFAGVVGGGNGSPAEAKLLPIAGASNVSSSALPYVQLLVCKKDSPAPPTARALPPGLLQFFEGDACPASWTRPQAPRGRHLVGLPPGGVPGAVFGGMPLAVGEERTHTHALKLSLDPPAAGIALASGCCGDGYAAHKHYEVSASSTAAPAALPTLHLLLCRKD